MGKLVYLDRNCYHHLRDRPKHGITEDDYQAILNAVKSGTLTIAGSVTLLEEHMPVLRAKDASRAPRERQLLEELTDPTKLIRDWQELLRYDVIFYALGLSPYPSPFTKEFTDPLQMLTPTPSRLPKLLDMVQETEVGKVEIRDGIKALKSQAEIDFTQAGIDLATVPEVAPTYDEVYRVYALETAEGLAERFGMLNQCRARGIKGLLNVRSVRLFTGASLSLSYAITFEPLKPARDGKLSKGYWHDLQHAIVASATDAFVTQDAEWRRMLQRVRIDNFEVIDLKTLVQQLS